MISFEGKQNPLLSFVDQKKTYEVLFNYLGTKIIIDRIISESKKNCSQAAK